ncbi:hypothetical protein WAI453_009031 [Rhynchosporium graminicola]
MLYKALRRQLLKTSCRGFASTAKREADFTHAVIGGGAVGLAIARQLAGRDGTSTVLIERNKAVGMETSSRNSEVIHAGLYYGATSLKTKLCIRGRQLLYALCAKHHIPHQNTGKWIVAQTPQQYEALVKIHEFTKTLLDVPTHFISSKQAASEEPHVRALSGILASPSTGIIDSHAYMQYLLSDLESKGGDIAYNSLVTSIQPSSSSSTKKGTTGWEITTLDSASSEKTTITASTLINSAGLSACTINNMIVPPTRHVKPYFAKGNYFSYASSHPRASRLIYPAPESGLGGLGTHLTLDLAGRIRFGPDIEWVDSPDDLAVNSSRLDEAIVQIRRFLPGVDEREIRPDYAGIRPKLGDGMGGGVAETDFVIRREEGYEGWVNLLGIESPGLTSSLAIAEMVEELLYK